MEKRATLEAEIRETSEEKAKHLRKAGWIPAVIYGQGNNVNLKVDNLTLRRVLREAGMTSLIDISIHDSRHTVLAKEVQTHATRGDLIHVDFYEVDMKAKIVVEATLTPVGIAAPVADGLGSTSLAIHSVEIECFPDNLISQIEVDLSQIEEPEDMIFVRDLPLSSGVDILADPDAVVVRFEYTPVEEEEEEEEEDLLFADVVDEVEVIAKGKQLEDDEEFEE